MFDEPCKAQGRYDFTCIGRDGTVRWIETIYNVVTNPGKGLFLDTMFAGSGYSTTGPFMGLIGSSGYSGVSAADTMISHSGWTELTSYSGSRPTMVWAAASTGSKSLSSPCSFAMTAGATIVGGFVVFGSGAVSTIGDTNGVLLSAGTFTTTRTVANGDTVQVNFTFSL